MTDHYYTIATNSEANLYKDRGSKFLGFAYRVRDEEQVQAILEHLRSTESGANHHCYAWVLGTEHMQYRANDDGEPSNSAGNPILGQIRSQNITNVLVVVVRYFGGTKLGVGGLMQAYKTTAALALEHAGKKRVWLTERLQVDCEYPQLNKIMRIIKKERIRLLSQEMDTSCHFILEVKKGEGQTLEAVLNGYKNVSARIV